jgi:hypothetical protein
MQFTRKALAVAGITGMALAAAAVPAFASSTPPSGLNATVTVAPTLSVSLSASSISFPGATPGGGYVPANQIVTATVTGNESWTIAFMPPSPASFTTSGGASFPVGGAGESANQGNMEWQVQGDPSWYDAGGQAESAGGSPASAPFNATEVYSYRLQVPAGTQAGSYSAGFSYVVSGA